MTSVGLNYFISALSTAVTTFSLAIFVLSRNPRSKLYKMFFLYTISISAWSFPYAFMAGISNKNLALILGHVFNFGVSFICVCFVHFVLILLQASEDKKRRVMKPLYTTAIIFTILVPTKLMVAGVRPKFGLNYFIDPGPLYYLYVLFWISCVTYGISKLFTGYKNSSGARRNQLKYLFFGTLIGYIGGPANFLLVFDIKYPLYPFGTYAVSIYTVITAYAIIKYRLMDIKIVLTRVGIFVVVYTLVLGIPLGLTGWGKYWLREKLGSNWYWAPVSFAIVLATLGPFIYIFLERKAEEKLLKEQKRYQNTLRQASMGMTRIRNLRRLLDLIAHIVTKAVRISYAGIYLYNKDANEYFLAVSRDKGRLPTPKLLPDNPLIQHLASSQLPLVYEEVKHLSEDNNSSTYKALEENMRLLTATVVIPSTLEDRLLALFVLGEKTSGQIYTPEDLNVFQVLASQAALAIENARFFEEAKQMQEQIAQAEKMATVGTMANGLSHQINNRFYALSLIAADTIDTIKSTDTGNCTPEIKEMLGHINHALKRIEDNVLQGGEVVKGILKYTRKQEEGFEDVTLDEILDSAFDMLQYKIRLREIDIIRNYPKDMAKIHGNRVQLQEVFFNFGDNAYDAITERRDMLKEPGYRGRVTFSAQRKGNMIEITIEDNGMGIQDGCSKKIFTPFFTTKASSHKGTGLGLYVIKKIITDNHKGKISFESAYKVGTRFIVELPATKE